MALTIKRLHELSNADLRAFGIWMRAEIRPESTSLGSSWACQSRQEPHYWSDEYLRELHADRERNLDIWVALKDGRPVATCWVVRGDPDRSMTQFMVDESLPDAEQLEVADALALQGIEDVFADLHPSKGDLIINYRLDARAEAYAGLCGFSRVETPGPDTPRRISFEALRENILARQRHG